MQQALGIEVLSLSWCFQMALRTETQQIIELVEKVSGCPVHVVDDPRLPTMANVKMARHPLPAHVIRFNPSRGPEGSFTGLQLVCMMYVGFQIVSPGTDVGMDLSKEYSVAQSLRQKRN